MQASTKYLASAVNIVSSSPCVGAIARIKICFLIINMHRLAHMNSKNYEIFTHATVR